jgi:hypothetical protein
MWPPPRSARRTACIAVGVALVASTAMAQAIERGSVVGSWNAESDTPGRDGSLLVLRENGTFEDRPAEVDRGACAGPVITGRWTFVRDAIELDIERTVPDRACPERTRPMPHRLAVRPCERADAIKSSAPCLRFGATPRWNLGGTLR